MARSTYVYVLLDNEEHGKPVAGFTVKWEMVLWITRHPGDYTIWRLCDGDLNLPPSEMRL